MRNMALIACVLGCSVGQGFGAERPGGVACWRGPEGSGAMGDSGLALVEDLSKARLLWKSEDRGCSIGYGADGVGKDGYVNFRSGYASPVAAEGRVYFETVASLVRICEVTGRDWPTVTSDAERREKWPWQAQVTMFRM